VLAAEEYFHSHIAERNAAANGPPRSKAPYFPVSIF
jgi:hypothetical protein